MALASAVAACGSDDSSGSSQTGGASGGGAGGSTSGGGGTTAGGAGGGGGSSGASGSGGAVSGGGGAPGGSGGVGGTDALPEGDTGIASKYPGDVGLAKDPSVIFFDDFESYAAPADLNKTYDSVYQLNQIRIATEAGSFHAGKKGLEFKVPKQDAELSNAVDKVLPQERDLLFLRYYSKFMPPFDVVGSSHNGSIISAHYFVNGNATPGVPADGKNKFLAALEDWRGEAATKSPGPLNVYIYHPEQRSQWGDHFFPTGTVLPNSSLKADFGPSFVSRPDVTPDLGKWYCYEFMVKANTPGKRDGRIAFWLDGKLTADFQNLRLRDIDSLKIDRFQLALHIGSNKTGETKKWYDDVVAASSYIGPMK
jgi:hypothetical protein